ESARTKRVQGAVVLELTFDASGNVADARVVSGPEELRKAALQSVLQWHFTHESAGNKRQVTINFAIPADSKPDIGIAIKRELPPVPPGAQPTRLRKI